MEDLKKRLRNPGWHDCNHHLTMDEAADHIEALEGLLVELLGAAWPNGREGESAEAIEIAEFVWQNAARIDAILQGGE